MRYGGSGNLTNVTIQYVGEGCTNDWQNFPKDKTKVALIARNNLIGCSINQKVVNAIENEAIAVIIFDDEDTLISPRPSPRERVRSTDEETLKLMSNMEEMDDEKRKQLLLKKKKLLLLAKKKKLQEKHKST